MAEGEAGQGDGEELLKAAGEGALWDGGGLAMGMAMAQGYSVSGRDCSFSFLSKQRSRGILWLYVGMLGPQQWKELRESGEFQGPKSQ